MAPQSKQREKTRHAGGLRGGPIVACLTCIFLGVWGAGQYVAYALAYQPQLGAPWFQIAGHGIYAPWSYFPWLWDYNAYAPDIFTRAIYVVAASAVLGFLGIRHREPLVLACVSPSPVMGEVWHAHTWLRCRDGQSQKRVCRVMCAAWSCMPALSRDRASGGGLGKALPGTTRSDRPGAPTPEFYPAQVFQRQNAVCACMHACLHACSMHAIGNIELCKTLHTLQKPTEITAMFTASDIIHSHTRANLLEDGDLVDVSALPARPALRCRLPSRGPSGPTAWHGARRTPSASMCRRTSKAGCGMCCSWRALRRPWR